MIECPKCGSKEIMYVESPFMNDNGEPEKAYYECVICEYKEEV